MGEQENEDIETDVCSSSQSTFVPSGGAFPEILGCSGSTLSHQLQFRAQRCYHDLANRSKVRDILASLKLFLCTLIN